MKIAIVGNSHLSALRHALRGGLFSEPDMRITFFGAQGRHFRKIALQGTRLVPTTTECAKYCAIVSGLRPPELDTRDYDAVVIHGGRVGPRHVLEAIQDARKVNPEIHYSRDFLSLMVRRYHLSTKAKGFRLGLGLIRSGHSNVMISETPLFLESKETALCKISDDDLKFISDMLGDLTREKKMEYLPQRAETRNGSFTKKQYASPVEGDFQHTGGLYGLEVLRSIKSALKK